MATTAKKKAPNTPFHVPDALIGAFATNHRINLYLIEHLPADAWTAGPLNGKGRSIAAMLAHMHNVRLMWLKAIGLPDGVEMPAKLDPAGETTLTREGVAAAYVESWQALEAVLRRALETDGRVKQFKPDVVSFYSYLVAHDAHHRGQISMLARQAGCALPQSAMFGMWEWGTR